MVHPEWQKIHTGKRILTRPFSARATATWYPENMSLISLLKYRHRFFVGWCKGVAKWTIDRLKVLADTSNNLEIASTFVIERLAKSRRLARRKHTANRTLHHTSPGVRRCDWCDGLDALGSSSSIHVSLSNKYSQLQSLLRTETLST